MKHLPNQKVLDKDLYSDLFPRVLYQAALAKGMPFAIWRQPGQRVQHLILDDIGQAYRGPLDLEKGPSGFAVGPFINPDLEQTHFIKARYHYTSIIASSSWHPSPETPSLDAYTLRTWAGLLSEQTSQAASASPKLGLPSADLQSPESQQYQALVQRGRQAIMEGHFQKVVLSRVQNFPYPEGFEAIQHYHKLQQAYPLAFCYLFYLPGVGIWAGASPETLISIEQDRIFRTVSLAGTQPYQDIPLSEVAWKQKEIEEQAMVSRYIINCFKKIRLREFEEAGPKTVVAGNLLHLKTFFKVDMVDTNFPELGTVMLRLLHPTSAVCGMPKDTAQAFIQAEEGYPRDFYSGFLGPVNMNGNSHLFVNLRCMQLCQDTIQIYAGAGITQDSHPDREFVETALKMETMLQVLHKNLPTHLAE